MKKEREIVEGLGVVAQPQSEIPPWPTDELPEDCVIRRGSVVQLRIGRAIVASVSDPRYEGRLHSVWISGNTAFVCVEGDKVPAIVFSAGCVAEAAKRGLLTRSSA